MEKPKNRDYLYHADGEDDPKCPICTHPNRKMVERIYLAGEAVHELAELVGCARGWIDMHGHFTGLLYKRTDDTDSMYGKMIEKYLNTFDEQEITPYMALAAARQKDVINGRTYPELEGNIGKVIFINAPAPMAGQARDVIDAAKPVQALMPAAGQQVEDAE